MNNVKNADAEFCGKVPLHQTNSIQPHGILVVVKKDDLTILQGSENADAVFLVPVTELVNRPITTFMAAEDAAQLTRVLAESPAGKLPFSFTVKEKRFLAVIEQHPLYIIFEIEREPHAVGESS